MAWERCVPLFLITELDTEKRYHFEDERVTGSMNDFVRVYNKHITGRECDVPGW